MNAALLILLLLSSAQSSPQTEPSHDITKVDPVAPDAAIATPLPREREKQLHKYGLDDLAGSRQAVGSQLVDGRLPYPLLDYYVHNGTVDQRISIFERGLVVVRMAGAGGTIQKRVLIPEGAMKKYLDMAAPDRLAQLETNAMAQPRENRGAFLRVYRNPASYVERLFDPSTAKPKVLQDAIMPLEDLLRAISEDRTVTNTIANYEPSVGDELVGDDRKTWRVVRVMKDAEEVVELHCTTQPTIMYVAKKDLYNYFIGRAAAQQ